MEIYNVGFEDTIVRHFTANFKHSQRNEGFGDIMLSKTKNPWGTYSENINSFLIIVSIQNILVD